MTTMMMLDYPQNLYSTNLTVNFELSPNPLEGFEGPLLENTIISAKIPGYGGRTVSAIRWTRHCPDGEEPGGPKGRMP
jgi:hypothetical protein